MSQLQYHMTQSNHARGHMTDSLGGVLTRYLRYWLSTSSSIGRWSGPSLLPLTVLIIFTHTSLLPLALTPSRILHRRASLLGEGEGGRGGERGEIRKREKE